MCIAVWLWDMHPRYRLLLTLNRDEEHDRPTESVHWWEGGQILGGKDCKSGGTWLASSRDSRIAFVTNFREPSSIPSAKSRGELVTRFLQSTKSPLDFAEEVSHEAEFYNGFNLILIDIDLGKSAYITNRHEGNKVSIQEVSPGLHCLCNAQLDTPWPKVERLKLNFKDLLEKFGNEEIPEKQIVENLMKDTTKANKLMLPKTGCPIEWEYHLSSIFVYIKRDNGVPYGTRSMMALSINRDKQLKLYEQFLEDGSWKEQHISFGITNK